MIKVENLTRRFGDFTAVKDVSFTIEKGETIGLLGPNGAGKTTTMRMITGVLAPTSGSVFIDGTDLSRHPEKAKRRIGYLPEAPPLYNEMTVKDYLAFTGRLHMVPRRDLPENIERVLSSCGLSGYGEKVIGTLSKGTRQRVGIAQALLHDPDILVLDEPTIGLDPGQIREIRNLIKELTGTRTVIFSTHILPEVPLLCDRVIIIHRGSVALDSPLDRLPGEKSLEDLFINVVAKEKGDEDEGDR